MSVKLAPSILSADFAHLADIVATTEAAGADYIHIDVMDGHFVPPLTIGPLVVEAIRNHTILPLDVHLMVIEPEKLVIDFVKAGADILTIHQESGVHLHRTVSKIHDLGARAGIAINPATSIETIMDVLPELDLILTMSVNPGYAGQNFIADVLPKVAKMRQLIDSIGLSTELEVDGGIKATNAAKVIAAGATVIVAGSAIYNPHASIEESVAAIRRGMEPRSEVEPS